MEIIKKISLIIGLIFFYASCKSPNIELYGNWSWISNDKKYYEVLIDSNNIMGYKHSFLYPREFKVIKDSIYIDKIDNRNNYDLSYKIKLINTNQILLIGKEKNRIQLNRIEGNSFTIDNIKNENDKNLFELHFSTREEAWKSKN